MEDRRFKHLIYKTPGTKLKDLRIKYGADFDRCFYSLQLDLIKRPGLIRRGGMMKKLLLVLAIGVVLLLQNSCAQPKPNKDLDDLQTLPSPTPEPSYLSQPEASPTPPAPEITKTKNIAKKIVIVSKVTAKKVLKKKPKKLKKKLPTKEEL